MARKAVLAAEFPELAARVNIQLPDEKSRRVGQSIAAASLPRVAERRRSDRPMLYIKNATIYTSRAASCPSRGSVVIDRAASSRLGPSDDVPAASGATVIDAAGCSVVPGFIDLQLNGAFGHDFTADPGAIWRVAARLPRYGVTSFLPTIITSPLNRSAAGQRVVTDGPAEGLPRRRCRSACTSKGRF